MNCRKTIFSLLIILMLLSPIGSTLVPPHLEVVGADSSPATSSLPSNSVGSASSEEENIDSFDVHPESLRWNTTLDDSLVDRVDNSLFEILAVNNETSSADGYEMNRGTIKTDGKFEWRMQSEGSGNQTEYFRDQIGDECDFTEGDQEGFNDYGGTSSHSIENGIMSLVIPSDFDGVTKTVAISQDAYTGVRYRVKASENVEWYDVYYMGDDTFTSDIHTITTEWQIFDYEWSDMNSRSSYEEHKMIDLFKFHTHPTQESYPVTVDFDYIEIYGDYDYATHVEGEVEDTWDWEVDNSTESFTTLEDMNVSGGLLRGRCDAVTNEFLESPAGLSVDTSLFTILKVRINTSSSINIIAYGRDSDNNLDLIGVSQPLTSSSLTVFEWDLSEDSDWNGDTFFQRILIGFTDESGNLEGDEIVFIDYVLLLGEYADSDSVIGLMDSGGTPLLNITTRFLGNNTERFEFELLDATGDISYYWYSDYYSDLDQFIIGKCTFDVLRSRLEITLTCENNTRIDKITFPQEFTVASGLTPPLFSNEIAPYIFVSTYTQDHSWQHVFIDWIKADFKEREWTRTDNPDDSDILESSYDFQYAQDDTDYSVTVWRLNAEKLDAISGLISLNSTDNNFSFQFDCSMAIAIYGVDWDDGEAHLLHFVEIGMYHEYNEPHDGFWISYIRVGYDNYGTISSQLTEFNSSGFGGQINPTASFSMFLDNERGEISTKSRGVFGEIVSGINDVVQRDNISDLIEEPSQEFIVEVQYIMQFSDDVEVIAKLEGFELFQRDIFSDIGDLIGEFIEGVQGTVDDVTSGPSDIFTTLFQWLGGIFKGVGDVLGVVFTTVGDAITGAVGLVETAIGTLKTALEAAIGTLKTALEAAIGLVETAIGTLQTALEAAIALVTIAVEAVTAELGNLLTELGNILGELQALAAAIATAIWDGIGDALDFITEAINGIFTFLIAAMSDIIDEIISVILSVLADIVDVIVGIVFWIWDAIELPDLLAVFDLFLVTLVEIITELPNIISDIQVFVFPLFTALIALYWFWLIFLSFAQEGFEPFSGINNMVERLLVHINISIMGFGPIPIPIALFFIPLTYFLIFPSGSVFMIW